MNAKEFEIYWNENYKPLCYADVQEAFEAFVKESEKHIFVSDYEEAGAISETDFMENLSQAAEFAFQDALTEIFYEKNPEVYETAFELFELAQMGEGDKEAGKEFHQEYNRLYREFLQEMFRNCFA